MEPIIVFPPVSAAWCGGQGFPADVGSCTVGGVANDPARTLKTLDFVKSFFASLNF